ncbi:hypothetical protein AAHA92_30666 [Salvia divinorum]|uniref:Secreted protein n=1 Tax=Salvia divinorum TaxID=28513 RepID=A0ABD1FRM3_SALDI
MKLSLSIAVFQLGLVISCVAAEVSTVSDARIQQSKKWCVVTSGATNENLHAFLNIACRRFMPSTLYDA